MTDHSETLTPRQVGGGDFRAERPLSIAFVSTCPPRECGIATFTSDLARAVKAADPTVRLSWAAINEAGSIHPYGPEVRWRIRQRQPAS